ncbi:hypothetical protein Ahy_B01g055428 [Arachis hypogaea]|uniref:Uncharacterized protein n=1 Tax=Arachis hypogaea TaxID=3818 RepID=A0A445AWD1_ARAHY|nr:hypothetical protein Ahy_B01g055428 [Arachis hypogaea]
MYIAAHCRASSPPLPWTPIGLVVGFLELLFCHRRCCSRASIAGERRCCRQRTTVEAATVLLSLTLVFLIGRLDVMMVDTGSVSRSADSLVDMMPEKDDDGRFASGGWNSEDGRLSCGYSSFRGEKVLMENFYDIKTLKIGGHSVCLLGVFDGHGGFRGAEYLKEHLFDNLMKHPKSLTNAKLL